MIAFSEIGVKSSFDGLSSNLLNNAGKKKKRFCCFGFVVAIVVCFVLFFISFYLWF